MNTYSNAKRSITRK